MPSFLLGKNRRRDYLLKILFIKKHTTSIVQSEEFYSNEFFLS